ncbi:J domain-containing protein [Frigidibacter sp. MR17.14]|uniref:J domain-containing protein n=1 Tax=Frigidibacter sp. MR17.14 TaxID=3126509 RepID=UPI003012C6CB
MSKNDPFGFDLRVSSDKKKRTKGRRGMSGAIDTSTRVCDHPGCEEQGQYRAPKSPDQLDEFFWFCKDHVREYNLKWNFFQGTTEDEFQKFIDKDRVWGRETKPFAKMGEEDRAWARLGVDDPHQILGDNATQNPGRGPTSGATRKLPPTERKAIEILEARDSWTKPEIRKQYKALIKVLHPDMNGGDRSDEERLQEVVWAWDQIKDSRNFRDA